MKQSDIASLILIVAISFTLAYFVGNSIFNTPESRSTPIEIVNPIEGTLPEPSATVFNQDSINPTEDIRINPSDTDKPFED